MESNPFGAGGEHIPTSPEGGGPAKPAKDKKAPKGREIAGPPAEPLFEKKTEVAKDAGETIWQRLGLGEEKSPKKPGGETDESRPVEPEEPAAEREPMPDDKEEVNISPTAETDEQTPAEPDDADAEVLVDHLSTLEQHEVASDYVDLRDEALEQEQKTTRDSTEYASAVEANQELVDQMKKELTNAAEDEPLSDVLDRAERPMRDRLEAAITAAAEKLPVDTPAESAEVDPSSTRVSPVAERPTVMPENMRDTLPPAVPPEEITQQVATVEASSSTRAGRWGSPSGENRGWYPSLAPWDDDLWRRDFPHFMRHRRERIKGEKRVKAVEKKLHKEVIDVQSQVAGREVTVRRLAAEQARLREQQAALPKRSPEVSRERAATPEAPRQRTVESLSREELLRESAGISVSGVTLRAVYEAKRIGEPGLRRLVAEYYRGGDMQLRLAEEMVEHERTFERDPLLREDHPMYEWLHGGSQAQGGGTHAIRQTANGPMSSTQASAGAAASQSAPTSASTKPSRQADPVLATLVIALIVIVILIYVALR